MCNFRFRIYHWPILTGLWFAITFITSYIVAVCIQKHVYPFFPYISDTGSVPPESCIFGEMLVIGAALMGVTMYVRHVQVNRFLDVFEIELNRRWEGCAFVLGIVSCVGISFVANFQQTTVGVMHFLGAFGAFGVGSVYFIIQTRISSAMRIVAEKTDEFGVSKGLYIFRVFLSVCLLPLFLSNMVFCTLSIQENDGNLIIYWTENDPGFTKRLIATFSEWLLAIFMMLYVISFTKEFKALRFKEINIQCICKQNEVVNRVV